MEARWDLFIMSIIGYILFVATTLLWDYRNSKVKR